MAHLGPSLRRRKRVARPWRRAALAGLVSLALNALVMFGIRVDLVPRATVSAARPIALAPLSAEQWAANRSVSGASTPRPVLPPVVVAPKPPPPPSQAPGQVVDVAPSPDNRPPDSSRFVSDRNNRVEKETRSRVAKAGYPNVLPRPSLPSGAAKQAEPAPPAAGQGGAQAAGGGRPGTRGAPGAEAPLASAPRIQPQRRLALSVAPRADLTVHPEQPPVPGPPAARRGAGGEAGEGGQGEARPGKPGPVDPGRLRPSAAFYDQLAGGPAPDHLEGVDVGDATFLNTREWKYATYFNRIKQAVATQWDPNTPLRERDPTGNMFAYRDRVTLLSVTLDDRGSLTDVRVQKTCGVDFLDQTAVEAFRRAQPFVNPPRGLADGHGEIKFSFGFYLEVGSPGLRLFRGPAPGQ